MDRVGVYEDAIKNTKKLYNEAIEMLDENIEYEYTEIDDTSEFIGKPDIEQNIKKVTLKDIYRVFRPDHNYSMIKSNTITNWHGELLNESVRKEIGVGSYVRVSLLDNYKRIRSWYKGDGYKIKKNLTIYKYPNGIIKKIISYNADNEDYFWCDEYILRRIEIIKYPDGRIEKSVKIFREFNEK